MPQPRLIKKHANRRLYDIELKQYVSLDDIRDLINTGTDVEIVDSKSGDDITRPVLLQIMAECEQDGRPMLSPVMLMALIRHYGHPMQDYVGPFLEKSLSFYMRQEARVRQTVGNISITSMRDSLMQILSSSEDEKR